jgi:hypothetical protein
MNTKHRQRLEVIFYSLMSGLLGVSLGYYWAAAIAADKVREFLAK